MESTGIVRNLDQLGRIVLPAETRRLLDIEIKDSIEIFIDGESLMFRKYAPGCVFCGESPDDLMYFRGKMVCKSCREDMATLKSHQV